MLSAVVVVSMTLLGQARGQEAKAAKADAGAAASAETGEARTEQAAPLRKARPPRNRGSWDVPKVPTVMGQQSATYEDAVGASTPMPGIVVPPPPEKTDDRAPPRPRDKQKH
jgi:hypothetical protein